MEKIKLVEILTEARQVLRGRWGKAVSVSVCLLLILLAVACLRFVNPLLYTAAYLLIAVQVVAGAQYIYLDMTRDEPTGLGRLFPPLRLYLPILGIFLLTVIACFIGICLFIVPGFVLSLGLSMSLYILRDRPELGVFGSMNASWKMMNGHPKKAGWINAIQEAQKTVQKGIGLDCPVLVMSSNKSFPETKEWNNEYLSSDIVLDIHDIQKYGQKLGNYVTRDTIQNGIHDLILSEKDSRDHVYRTVFDWLPGK